MPVLPDVGSISTVLPGVILPSRFERVDHRHADAVLDRRQRVEELELHQNVGLRIRLLGDLGEPHQRRVPDRLGDVVVDPAAAPALGRGQRLDVYDLVHGASASRSAEWRSIADVFVAHFCDATKIGRRRTLLLRPPRSPARRRPWHAQLGLCFRAQQPLLGFFFLAVPLGVARDLWSRIRRPRARSATTRPRP